MPGRQLSRPRQIQLDIAYAPAFSPSGLPITLRNLVFERASVVFNLAALYSQLAELEDRSHIDGIKRAISYYQVSFTLDSTLNLN